MRGRASNHSLTILYLLSDLLCDVLGGRGLAHVDLESLRSNGWRGREEDEESEHVDEKHDVARSPVHSPFEPASGKR